MSKSKMERAVTQNAAFMMAVEKTCAKHHPVNLCALQDVYRDAMHLRRRRA